MDYTLIVKYQDLWDKYLKGELAGKTLPILKMSSQEESISWSLKIKEILDSKARQHDLCASQLTRCFLKGKNLKDSLNYVNQFLRLVATGASDADITEGDILQTEVDINQNILLFEFDSVGDLFLAGETDEIGVIPFD
jgi:hypothetical protein